MSHMEMQQSQEIARLELERIRAMTLTPKARLGIPVQDMPNQNPDLRRANMEEVATGYTREQAIIEAERCLQCRNAPCVAGCPVKIDIPGFIAKMKEGDFAEAATVIKRTNLLPSICGRVCPQEKQCQLPCTVGKALGGVEKAVQIGRLERWEKDSGGRRGARWFDLRGGCAPGRP
ncbi:MAG: glutamate synthase (NADPH/NADH) small chain [Spirochaetes bacterium]|nr:MAG: glutamate synthase (NADPH/NADH) small chain [Spirochaetota bacterium]